MSINPPSPSGQTLLAVLTALRMHAKFNKGIVGRADLQLQKKILERKIREILRFRNGVVRESFIKLAVLEVSEDIAMAKRGESIPLLADLYNTSVFLASVGTEDAFATLSSYLRFILLHCPNIEHDLKFALEHIEKGLANRLL